LKLQEATIKNKGIKMKTIIFFFLLTAQYFAQINGCLFEATIDTTGESNYHACGQSHQFAFLTIALADSGDTVIVYSGTNKPDSTIEDEDYDAISLVDISTGDDVDNGLITGDEAIHTYFIKWAYKRTNFKVYAYKAPNGASYTLEFY